MLLEMADDDDATSENGGREIERGGGEGGVGSLGDDVEVTKKKKGAGTGRKEERRKVC